MIRLAIITHEPIAELMAGPAIRAIEMARALVDTVEPLVATPYPVTRRLPDGVLTEAYEFGNEASLIRILDRADVVLLQGFTLEKFPVLAESHLPIVVDLYCPFQFENLERLRALGAPAANADYAATVDLEVLSAQLHRGDFFICATERQRDLWLGMLYALGRMSPRTYGTDPGMRTLVDVVPFGLPEVPPTRAHPTFRVGIPGINPTDRLVVWGGSVLEWQDPMTVVDAVGRVAEQIDTIRLVLPGDHHPNPEVPPMPILDRLRTHAESEGLLDRFVFFAPWVAYDQRGNYLVEADLGVSAHKMTLETRFAWRTRMLDYVWASLPIVCTEGDSFGEIVASRGLGLVVPPEDSQAMAEAMLELLKNPSLAMACRTRLAELRPEFHWRRVVAPLRQFLEHPGRRDPVRPDENDSVRG